MCILFLVVLPFWRAFFIDKVVVTETEIFFRTHLATGTSTSYLPLDARPSALQTPTMFFA